MDHIMTDETSTPPAESTAPAAPIVVATVIPPAAPEASTLEELAAEAKKLEQEFESGLSKLGTKIHDAVVGKPAVAGQTPVMPPAQAPGRGSQGPQGTVAKAGGQPPGSNLLRQPPRASMTAMHEAAQHSQAFADHVAAAEATAADPGAGNPVATPTVPPAQAPAPFVTQDGNTIAAAPAAPAAPAAKADLFTIQKNAVTGELGIVFHDATADINNDVAAVAAWLQHTLSRTPGNTAALVSEAINTRIAKARASGVPPAAAPAKSS
jgi:hypothetical protein